MSAAHASGPRLARMFTRERWPLCARLVAVGVGQAAGSIATALLVRSAYHSLAHTSTGGSTHILLFAAALSAAVGLAAWMRAAERVVAERLGQHYVTEVRADLFEHLTRVPARHLGRRKSGNMLLRFVGDLSALRSWVSLGLAKLLVAGIAVTLALACLVVIDPGIGIAVSTVLAVGSVATLRTSPRLMSSSRAARSSRAKLTGEVVERLTQIGVLQAAGQQRREHRRVSRLSTKVSEAMIERARAAGVCRAVAEATSGLATVAVVVVGAVEVQAGRTSAATVLGAVTIVGMLAGRVRDLGRVTEYASDARVARAAALRFLALPTLPDPAGTPDLIVGPGCLEFDGIGLDAALSDITLRAESGETIAVVGTNGAGKSSLMSLAGRLVDPDAGAVRLDGQDLRSRRLASVRAAIGMAGADLPLMRGTVARNVLYRRPGASEAEIARVSALCGLDELVATLPDGWDTEVGGAGSRLSAGQRARISVARAALGRPRLLLLDEAEAHLDSGAAEVVDRVLADHKGTALVVTHRRELVERADVVWCLDRGRVVELGPPSVLLARNGPTGRLFGNESARSRAELRPESVSVPISGPVSVPVEVHC